MVSVKHKADDAILQVPYSEKERESVNESSESDTRISYI